MASSNEARNGRTIRKGRSGRGGRSAIISALGFFVAIHVVALPAMALLVQPGFDQRLEGKTRALYVSNHPWLWRLGWLPWQLCALSDVILSVLFLMWALRRSNRVSARWFGLGLVANLLAAIPEQRSELHLVTRHVSLAREAVHANSVVANSSANIQMFFGSERSALWRTSVWGASAYIVMTLAWHMGFARAAKTKPLASPSGILVAITTVGLGLAAIFLVVQFRTDVVQSVPITITAAIGFLALIAWSVSLADLYRRANHARLDISDPHNVVWPSTGISRHLASLANSRGIRDLVRLIPFVPLRSDIEDVVYLNWLVPTVRAEKLLPAPLRCDNLDGLTAVSILTYRHGHFGPKFLGPFRRIYPSPLQSNWRLYVGNVPSKSGEGSVYFLTSVLSNGIYALASRMFADGLPGHYAKTFEHDRSSEVLITNLGADGGSGPELSSSVRETSDGRVLPSAWNSRFSTWEQAVTYLVEQNRALRVDPVDNVVHESVISIPIRVGDVRPASISTLAVNAFGDLFDDAEPFVFVVSKVAFEALSEGPIEPPTTSTHVQSGAMLT
jgi:hypothetical protein